MQPGAQFPAVDSAVRSLGVSVISVEQLLDYDVHDRTAARRAIRRRLNRARR